MILVAGFFAGLPSGAQQSDRPSIFAPEVVEPRDVVVSLSHQNLHAVLLCERASFLVCSERSLKIVQGHQTTGDIVEGHGYRFRRFGPTHTRPKKDNLTSGRTPWEVRRMGCVNHDAVGLRKRCRPIR
jgi:hypothetical protein